MTETMRAAARGMIRVVEEMIKTAVHFDQNDEHFITWIVGISAGAIALLLSSNGGEHSGGIRTE